MNPVVVVPLAGFLSFLSPCMWNLNLLLRAYIKRGSGAEFLYMLLSRLALMNFIAFLLYLLSGHVGLSKEVLITVQIGVAILFMLGFPLMRRFGFAPIDLSLQFLFPQKKFPPGLALGFSLPYCSIPFVVLLGAYSLHFREPFLIFNLYALSVSLPVILTLLLKERHLKLISSLIPGVPALTGFLLILSLGSFLDSREINLYVSSLIQERQAFFLLLPLMFLLGFLTSLGPSTLPFLPVVFGFIVSKHKSLKEITLSVVGFSLSFLLTHSVVGLVASTGTLLLSDIFRTQLFNLLLSVFLLFVSLNLLGVFSLSFELARLNPFSGAGRGGFLLGIAYTFSLCPSCTSLLLGALVLSASYGNPLLSAYLMGVYALGRAVPIFLSGLVVSSMREFLQKSYAHINKAVGVIFLLLAGYFFKNFLEVSL